MPLLEPSFRPRRPLFRSTIAMHVAVACVALTACTTVGTITASSEPAASATYTTPRTMPAGKGSGEADGVYPRTVTHFQGKTTIPAEPKRVIVISTGQADALLTLGVVPVASTAGDGADLIPSYLKKAFPGDAAALANVASVGDRFAPDIETIAKQKPDLILMNIAGKDAASLYSNLSNIAPTVATQGTGLYWKQDFLLLADAIGKTQQAESWLDTYQKDAASFGETVTGSPNISFLRYNADRLRVFGIASFGGSVAEDAGLTRPDTQTFTNETSHDISEEQIEQADGDHVFAGVQGGDTNQLTDLPLWKTLNAADQDAVTFVDDDVFYLNTGPTAARAILSTLATSLK